MKTLRRLYPILSLLALALMTQAAYAQPPEQNIDGGTPPRGAGRPVTIPLTIRMNEDQTIPELQNIDLVVREDGEPQTILSIRGLTTPITLAVLIQDDLVPSVSNEIKALAQFI